LPTPVDRSRPTPLRPPSGTHKLRADGTPGDLRRAAQALLDAWDNRDEGLEDLTGAVAALRATLAARASALQRIDRVSPRPNTKQAQAITMLARDEGASGPQIADAMGWAPHTVRGFLAGLARKGLKVEVLDRVRQVGPDKQGAKGSYSVYRLVAAAES
jgi:hypothetical protein